LGEVKKNTLKVWKTETKRGIMCRQPRVKQVQFLKSAMFLAAEGHVWGGGGGEGPVAFQEGRKIPVQKNAKGGHTGRILHEKES